MVHSFGSKLRRLAALVGCILAAWATSGSVSHAQNPAAAPVPSGIEVLARGPIHEAFAESIDQQPAPGPLVPRRPPANIEEIPPDQRPAEEGVQWIPGYWSWDDERRDFIWISGLWRVPPPSRQWMPGHWTEVAGAWQWSPGLWTGLQQQDLQFLPPPPEPINAAPALAAPSVNSFYVPGNFVYRESRYIWRAGFWIDRRPGWVYVPAHFVWTPVGYVFVEGYWDLDLRRRGLLFAPVYFSRSVVVTALPVYQPTYVVRDDFLLGALFVRPGYRSYYFGDYFDTAYARHGFVTWIDFRFGRTSYDPLYDYYRWHHRSDGRWDADLRAVYVGRTSGSFVRPPRTLLQQSTVVNNITINNNRNTTVNNAQSNIQVLTSLNSVPRSVTALQPVTRDQRLTEQRQVQAFQAAAQQRNEGEARLLARSSGTSKSMTEARSIKVSLPPSRATLSGQQLAQPKASAGATPVAPPATSNAPGATRTAPAGSASLVTPPATGSPRSDPSKPGKAPTALPPGRLEKPAYESKPVSPSTHPGVNQQGPPVRSNPIPPASTTPPPKVEPKPPAKPDRPPGTYQQSPPVRSNPTPPASTTAPPKVEPKPPAKPDRPPEAAKPSTAPKSENKPPMGGATKGSKQGDDKKSGTKGDGKKP